MMYSSVIPRIATAIMLGYLGMFHPAATTELQDVFQQGVPVLCGCGGLWCSSSVTHLVVVLPDANYIE